MAKCFFWKKYFPRNSFGLWKGSNGTWQKSFGRIVKKEFYVFEVLIWGKKVFWYFYKKKQLCSYFEQEFLWTSVENFWHDCHDWSRRVQKNSWGKKFFERPTIFTKNFDFQQKLTECGETISAGLSKLKYLVDRNFWSSNFSLKYYIISKNSLRKWSSLSWTGIIKLLPMCLYETLRKLFFGKKNNARNSLELWAKNKKQFGETVSSGLLKAISTCLKW